jgi:hypothetical protein
MARAIRTVAMCTATQPTGGRFLLAVVAGVMAERMRIASTLARLALGTLGAGVVLACAACAAGTTSTCRIGADCASGACRSDGTCTDTPPGDGGVGDGAPIPDDTGTPTGDGSASDAPVTGCAGNKDGAITREETPLAAGLRATYRVATGVPINTAGTTNPDGTRHWDFSGVLTGDHTLVIETVAPTGQWFAADFAGATYTVRLSDKADLLGVFELTPSALLLRGVVSPADGAGTRTKLKYAPVASTLTFPMQKGSTWTTSSVVSGEAKGIYPSYTEATTYDVDASGDLVTPLGTYSVLRIKATLTRGVTGFPPSTTVHSFAFVAECAGTVARVVSNDNETVEEFTTASEVQRSAP